MDAKVDSNMLKLLEQLKTKSQAPASKTEVEAANNKYKAEQTRSAINMIGKGATAQQMFDAGIRPDIIEETMKYINQMKSSPNFSNGLMK